MSDDVAATALSWQAQRRPAVVVEVAAARGSVPRGAGTRMLVAADAVVGSVGGGHLELKAIGHARALLHGVARAEAVERERFALGPALGQCCGGAVELAYTPLDRADPAAWPPPAPRFWLQLHGAGHVGRAVVRLLSDIDCRVQWVDGRADEYPSERPLPAHVEAVVTESPAAEVAGAPPGAAFLVMTHSHALDFDIVRAVLARNDDRDWLGLIGSASKRAHFESRLRQRGVAAPAVARMRCPVGVEGIAGKEPAVIAVAIVAQLLQRS